MNRNIVYVFTGTGNSLKVAKDIAMTFGNCDILSMGSDTQYELKGGYETIGFVLPTYFRGEPRKVTEFISRLDLQNNKNAYYYAVATAGKYDGNTLPHIKKLLKRKGITLHYGKMIDMFSNYVISYDMRDTIEEEAKKSEIEFEPILKSIKNRETNKVQGIEPLQEIVYRALIQLVPEMDKYYRISDECIRCGICEKVCPVDNIGLDNTGRPYFKHHCEQCLACIQFCPKKAINYKDKTQSRRRYTHPAIKYTDLATLNRKGNSLIAKSIPVSFLPKRKKSIGSIISNLIAKATWKIYGM
jgi:ferredoxin